MLPLLVSSAASHDERRVWQSPRLGLLKWEVRLPYLFHCSMLGVICSHIYVQCSDSCSQFIVYCTLYVV